MEKTFEVAFRVEVPAVDENKGSSQKTEKIVR